MNVELRVADDPYNDFTPFKYKLNPDIIAVSSHTPFLDKKKEIARQFGVKLEIVMRQNPQISTTQLIKNKNWNK